MQTLTTRQIHQLRDLYLAEGNDYLVQVCDIALSEREEFNDEGAPLVWPNGTLATRTEAHDILVACAD